MVKRAALTVLTPAAAALVALAAYGLWPKAMPHPMEPTCWTMHYRGLGLAEEDGFFGKRWTHVTFVSPDDGGTWRFEFDVPGYNPFQGFYPNGQLREEGECLVERMGLEKGPYPDPHQLFSARCYRPDGTLGSQVIDGTGTQTIWNPGGTKTWELELRNGQRAKVAQWHPNGQLWMTRTYVDGEPDGAFTNYDAAGNKTIEGAYVRGKRIGKWTYYNSDGSVARVDQN